MIPDLSLIVPTYGRGARLARLLASLASQTFPAERFEVVVVDDGSPEPVRLDAEAFPFALRLLRQANAGPAAARNRALEAARAPRVLILNDDAVPAADLLARHQAAHAGAPPRTAVLGSFEFTAQALTRPFVQVLAASSLLFDFPNLRDAAFHDWSFFWTCNLSLDRAALLEAGGFDAERFREAIVEDVELGWRMQQRGWRVLHRADARCEHDHELTPADWIARSVRLGVNTWRFFEKHGDPRILGLEHEREVEPHLQTLQIQWESYRDAVTRLEERLSQVDTERRGTLLPQLLLRQIRVMCHKVSVVPYGRGLVMEAGGADPEARLVAEAPRGELTSVIIPCHDEIERTRRCLTALRAAADPERPTELIFVDNGSRDGTPEWLAAQPDVQLLRNAENLGAPHARNQAIPLARGRWLAFLDDDAMVSPGWLERLQWHAAVDPRVGCVCPVSDRAAHHQQVEYPGGGNPAAIRAFAGERAAKYARRGVYKTLFTSFCVLVRREVVEAIGGFDERFSPWGFEDDDFSLRAHLAGFRSRLALDVFVRHEAYGGPRQERHQRLLRRNWERFARKWGSDKAPPYGEYGFLEAVEGRRVAHEQLRVPVHRLA